MGVRELLAGDPAAPFERASEADAATLALRHCGVHASRVTRVETVDMVTLGKPMGNGRPPLAFDAADATRLVSELAAVLKERA